MNIITTQNTKLGGRIAQVNMPYLVSCREDAPCKKECYCNKGNLRFDNVRQSHMDKYNMYLSNPKGFFDQINNELSLIPYKYFRWHSSGDIVDEQYLDLMCKLARKNRNTRFLAYTKKYELVNDYFDSHRKPDNLIIVLSNWGMWKPENRHNFPESYVDFGNTKRIPEFAYPCGGHCDECEGVKCWHLHKGDSVVFKKH